MDIAEQIRAARGGMSREQFAGMIGCSLHTVIRWETGRTTPTDYLHIVRLNESGVDLDTLKASCARREAAA